DRRIRTLRTRDDAARLLRVVPAGVRDDRVEDLAADGQHGYLAYNAPLLMESSSDSCNTPRYSYMVSWRTRDEVGSRMTASSSSAIRSLSSRMPSPMHSDRRTSFSARSHASTATPSARTTAPPLAGSAPAIITT